VVLFCWFYFHIMTLIEIGQEEIYPSPIFKYEAKIWTFCDNYYYLLQIFVFVVLVCQRVLIHSLHVVFH